MMEFFFAQQKVFFCPGVYRKRNIFFAFHRGKSLDFL